MAITIGVRSQGHATATGSTITFDLPRIVIGRGDTCDLRIPDLSVSHRHASLRQQGTEYQLLDEGSTNGTHIGRVRLHPHAPRAIRDGDLIRLGRVWLELRLEFAPPTAMAPEATRDLAIAMVRDALQGDGQKSTPFVEIIKGPDAGKEQPLRLGEPVVLGRGRDADFMIDLPDASRRHARLLLSADTLLIRDLGSRIGTSVEGDWIRADQDTTLRPGDNFEVGPNVFTFHHPVVQALHRLETAEDEPISSNPSAPPTPDPVAAPPVAQPPDEQPSRSNVPSPPRRKRVQDAQEGAWGRTDVLIVLLALAVLALSGVGLFWLFGTN